MIFHSDGEFNQFLDTVLRHHSNLMANTKFNNIDMFIEFYNEYRHYMNTYDADFIDFFQRYQPRFRPNEDCTGMAIELLNRIAYEVPDVQYHSYLTTCAINIKEDAYESLNGWTGRLPRKFIHGHVAGFIRISVQNRLGYVILDPGFALQYPIVIMEDGHDPHLPVSFGSGRNPRGQNFEFQLLGWNTPYILARTFRPNSRIPVEAFLYAVGSPYCSFQETTTKPNQLNLSKSMVSRTATGAPTAAVYVDLKASEEEPLVFNVALYGGSKRTFSVPLSQPNQMSQKCGNSLYCTAVAGCGVWQVKCDLLPPRRKIKAFEHTSPQPCPRRDRRSHYHTVTDFLTVTVRALETWRAKHLVVEVRKFPVLHGRRWVRCLIVFEKVRLGALEIVEQVAERKGEFGIPHTLSLSFDASPFLLRGT
ncbi:uncharacterized protein LOC103507746 [Diaphorina citri]|uniref:Uncharacterized protein LOC103507746 n=1 Tax=Diaphorina citri TaxID=121845 RepID=A0A1S3CYI0_DIACI|nr:uncharacterized protein LOC103507746 [Diaphorina citri]